MDCSRDSPFFSCLHHSLWFMDAYQKGVNGAEAAWASKKYCGHQVLPESLMMDMDKYLS
ncbi:hypothetical protein BS47DRAFT_1293455 [Hydnum rufescens UP504]|uniref:Uncharacterized protein n=1 Tax=Hydnum rufescens UP504 TaxID=1448309 RepID=A0A9P6B1D6_9AGAM|nr:hypothetical protein BS47DRAFT_1293455 [Hydnum rufescens UP504]